MRVIVPGPLGWQSSLPIQMTRSPNTSLRAIAVFMMMPPQMIAHEENRLAATLRDGKAFRCGASSPIDQCSDIAPRTAGTLTTLNLAPSSVFSQLLAWPRRLSLYLLGIQVPD